MSSTPKNIWRYSLVSFYEWPWHDSIPLDLAGIGIGIGIVDWVWGFGIERIWANNTGVWTGWLAAWLMGPTQKCRRAAIAAPICWHYVVAGGRGRGLCTFANRIQRGFEGLGGLAVWEWIMKGSESEIHEMNNLQWAQVEHKAK